MDAPTFELYPKPMTKRAFGQLLATAPKGFPIVYHIGDLMYDRAIIGDALDAGTELRPLNPKYPHQHALDELAIEVTRHSDAKECFMVQKRLGKYLFEYRAMKR